MVLHTIVPLFIGANLKILLKIAHFLSKIRKYFYNISQNCSIFSSLLSRYLFLYFLFQFRISDLELRI